MLSAPRERILDFVREHPGCPLGELTARLGIGWGTLHHHLRVLESGGHVRRARSGRRTLVFAGPRERAPPEVAGHGILVGRTARAVARVVVQRPGLALPEVAEATGQSGRAAYYHLRRLVQAGLVTTGSPTRYAGLAPTPVLARLLRELDARAA